MLEDESIRLLRQIRTAAVVIAVVVSALLLLQLLPLIIGGLVWVWTLESGVGWIGMVVVVSAVVYGLIVLAADWFTKP